MNGMSLGRQGYTGGRWTRQGEAVTTETSAQVVRGKHRVDVST